LLYFLLDRDCPIRQVTVPFYQPEELQRQVTARLETNRSVRAVLLSKRDHGVDWIPNRVRAPLCLAVSTNHFKPAF
jgi:hypothetical protein